MFVGRSDGEPHVGHVTRIGEMRNAYRILVGNRPRLSWLNNIKMDRKEIARTRT
jgi:hypothetical protein